MAVAEFKTSVLLIAMMCLAMFVVGIVLYAFAEKISAFGYLLLPLPPIAVASYIYLNNWLVDNDVSSLKGAAFGRISRKRNGSQRVAVELGETERG